MRISDWSSDVCSSDQHAGLRQLPDDLPADEAGAAEYRYQPQRHAVSVSPSPRGAVMLLDRARRSLRRARIKPSQKPVDKDGVVERPDRKSTRLNSSH